MSEAEVTAEIGPEINEEEEEEEDSDDVRKLFFSLYITIY